MNVPNIYFPNHLPVSQRVEDIKYQISKNQVTIICGETGSGKTTQLPKICLSLGRGQKKQMQDNLEKYKVIMDSMTQLEKDEPLLLKHSRIRRIAKGSGCTEKDVKDLIGQWNKSKKMMKGMKGDRKMRRQMQSMMNIDDADFDLG